MGFLEQVVLRPDGAGLRLHRHGQP
jgi:hypothetical protein